MDASVEACDVFGDSLAVYWRASSLSLRLHLGRGHFGIIHLILYSEAWNALEFLGMPWNALECLVQDSDNLKKECLEYIQVPSVVLLLCDQLSPVALRQDLCCGLHTLDLGTEDSAVHFRLLVFHLPRLRFQHHRSVSGWKDVGESAWILQEPLGSQHMQVNRECAISKRPQSTAIQLSHS